MEITPRPALCFVGYFAFGALAVMLIRLGSPIFNGTNRGVISAGRRTSTAPVAKGACPNPKASPQSGSLAGPARGVISIFKKLLRKTAE